MKIATKLLFLIALSFTVGCQAGNSKSNFPEGCTEEGISYNGENLLLKDNSSSKQSLYLFYNISDKSFWLNHPVAKDPGASAGWASEVSSGNWSALTINSSPENFVMTCSIIGDDGVKYLNCKDVVKTCRIENAAFNSGDSGSYWVAENKPLQDLTEAIKSRGISW